MSPRRLLVAAALAAGLIGTSATAAIASMNVNATFYSGYAQVSYNTDRHDGMVGIFDISIKRGMAYQHYKDMICDYQAMATLTLP